MIGPGRGRDGRRIRQVCHISLLFFPAFAQAKRETTHDAMTPGARCSARARAVPSV
jgi:hypothetical protein